MKEPERPIRVLELRSVRGTGGGPEKTIMLGAARADRSRFEIVVCYIRDLRDQVYRLHERAQELDIEYVEVFERHSFDLGIWRQLRELIRARRIDIVHAHEYKTDLLAYCLARAEKVIPLATAHAWTGNSARERYLYYPIDKRLLAKFPRVISVSSEIRNELLRHGAAGERVVVILNTIDAQVFRRQADLRAPVRHELGYGDDDVVIGSVGRFERQKRFDLLLQAFAAVAPARPELRLLIVGEGSLRAGLADEATRLGLGDRCRFVGHRDDIARVHHAIDLFVQSSEYEGTPNAVLEAMAMETPLVATDVGGTRELAEHGIHALIVPKNDVPLLSAAIESALSDPKTARTRADAARHRVEANLSFEARTRRLESIYSDLIGERRANA